MEQLFLNYESEFTSGFVVKGITCQKTISDKNAKKLFWKEKKITNHNTHTMYAHLQISLVKLRLHLCRKYYTLSLITDVKINKG